MRVMTENASEYYSSEWTPSIALESVCFGMFDTLAPVLKKCAKEGVPLQVCLTPEDIKSLWFRYPKTIGVGRKLKTFFNFGIAASHLPYEITSFNVLKGDEVRVRFDVKINGNSCVH